MCVSASNSEARSHPDRTCWTLRKGGRHWVSPSPLLSSLESRSDGLYDSTLIDSISAGGSLIEEPRLSACLVLARASLFTRRSGLDEIRPPRAGEHDLTIWNRAAMQMSKYISCRPASEHFANFESNPFRVFSQFFRHELVLATHLTNFKDKGVHNKNLIILAVKRLFRELPALRQSCINKALFDRITDTAVQYQLVFGVNLEQSLREGDTRRRT